MKIRVVSDGERAVHGARLGLLIHEHSYQGFARARLSVAEHGAPVYELYLDANGNLELCQLPAYNEGGEARVLYRLEKDHLAERRDGAP